MRKDNLSTKVETVKVHLADLFKKKENFILDRPFKVSKRSPLRIRSYLLKKSLMENFIFCAVLRLRIKLKLKIIKL